MFIACIHRHLAVCSLAELPSFTKRDVKFWNVISLLGPQAQNPMRANFRDHYRAHFDDVCAAPSPHTDNGLVVSAQTMRGVLKFVDERPEQPILVHCVAGISRSPAAALVILLRGFLAAGESMPVQTAIEAILAIRPQVRPNPLVLQTGLGCFVSEGEAAHITAQCLDVLRGRGSMASDND